MNGRLADRRQAYWMVDFSKTWAKWIVQVRTLLKWLIVEQAGTGAVKYDVFDGKGYRL